MRPFQGTTLRPGAGSVLAAICLTTTLCAQATAPTALQGRVIDERGQPLAGATITVVTADWTTAAAQAEPHAISTADGRFRIEATVARDVAGSALVVVTKAGHATACLEHPSLSGEPLAILALVGPQIGEVMLPPATKVTGKVRTRQAKPVTVGLVEARCQLQTLLRPCGMWSSRYVARARTDAAGEFTLPDAIASGVVVQATAIGLYRQTAPGTLGTESMLFELEPSGEVTGKVITTDGAPLPGMVCLVHGSERGPSQATAADGSFRLGIDLAGPFVVEARPFGTAYEFGVHFSPTQNRATEGLRLQLPAATPVVVRVQDRKSGRAVADAEVRIAFVTPPAHQYIVAGILLGLPAGRTDANGEFLLSERRAGTAGVAIGVVQAKGYAPSIVQGASPRTGEPMVIDLVPGATVAGVVREAATGKPIAGARVGSLGVDLGADSMMGMLSHVPVASVSDAEGRYRLPDLGASALRLRAAAPGFAPTTIDLRITDEQLLAADFALQPGTTLTASLGGADAAFAVGLRPLPADAAADMPNPWDWSLPMAVGASPRRDGKYVLPDLHGPQQVEALLMLPSYRGQLLKARLGPFAGTADAKASFDLDRSSLARLKGRVRLTGVKLPRHRLAVALADVDLQNDAFAASRPGDDGRFELPVPPTWFAVQVVDLETGLVLAERTLRGESGTTHEVDIQLELHEAKVTLVGDPAKLRQCSLHLSRPEPDTLAQLRIETGDAPVLPLPHALVEGRTEFTVLAPAGPLHATLTQGRPLARRLASADITVQAKRANRLQLELP